MPQKSSPAETTILTWEKQCHSIPTDWGMGFPETTDIKHGTIFLGDGKHGTVLPT
jgi:hypothetical protein